MPLQAIKLGLDQPPISRFLGRQSARRYQCFRESMLRDLGPHDHPPGLPALALAFLAGGRR
jgi:hypothetical protein